MQISIRDDKGNPLTVTGAVAVDGTDGVLCTHNTVGPILGNMAVTLTHVPTGWIISQHSTREKAIEAAELIWGHIKKRKLFASDDPEKVRKAVSRTTRDLIRAWDRT